MVNDEGAAAHMASLDGPLTVAADIGTVGRALCAALCSRDIDVSLSFRTSPASTHAYISAIDPRIPWDTLPAARIWLPGPALFEPPDLWIDLTRLPSDRTTIWVEACAPRYAPLIQELSADAAERWPVPAAVPDDAAPAHGGRPRAIDNPERVLAAYRALVARWQNGELQTERFTYALVLQELHLTCSRDTLRHLLTDATLATPTEIDAQDRT